MSLSIFEDTPVEDTPISALSLGKVCVNIYYKLLLCNASRQLSHLNDTKRKTFSEQGSQPLTFCCLCSLCCKYNLTKDHGAG